MYTQTHKALVRIVKAVFPVVFLFTAQPVYAETTSDNVLFFWKDDGGKYTSTMADLHGKERYTAILNRSAFGEGGLRNIKRIVINLTPDLTIVPIRQHFEDRRKNGGTWFGQVEGVPGSEVILTRNNNWLGGYVAYQGRSFWITPIRRSLYEIVELDDASFMEIDDNTEPKEGQPGPGAIAGRYSEVMHWLGFDATEDDWRFYRKLTIEAARNGLRPIPEDGSNIDVLVVYTPSALNAVNNPFSINSTENIEGTIQLAFDQANKSFINSGIPTRLNLVTTPIEVDFSEGPTFLANVTALRNYGDGILDEVHFLRNFYAADIVVMMTGSPKNACGRVFMRRHSVNLTGVTREEFEAEEAANAFAVVDILCAATSSFSFTHEVGHILGAQHDRVSEPTIDGTFEEDARGWISVSPAGSPAFRTVMAYDDFCVDNLIIGCPRWLYWSDPNKMFLGVPMGSPVSFVGAADSTFVLTSRTIIPVSNYRWWGCRYMACAGLVGPLP